MVMVQRGRAGEDRVGQGEGGGRKTRGGRSPGRNFNWKWWLNGDGTREDAGGSAADWEVSSSLLHRVVACRNSPDDLANHGWHTQQSSYAVLINYAYIVIIARTVSWRWGKSEEGSGPALGNLEPRLLNPLQVERPVQLGPPRDSLAHWLQSSPHGKNVWKLSISLVWWTVSIYFLTVHEIMKWRALKQCWHKLGDWNAFVSNCHGHGLMPSFFSVLLLVLLVLLLVLLLLPPSPSFASYRFCYDASRRFSCAMVIFFHVTWRLGITAVFLETKGGIDPIFRHKNFAVLLTQSRWIAIELEKWRMVGQLLIVWPTTYGNDVSYPIGQIQVEHRLRWMDSLLLHAVSIHPSKPRNLSVYIWTRSFWRITWQ